MVKFYGLDAKQQKKYHFRSSVPMCISRKHADYNGKKIDLIARFCGKK